MVNDQEPLVVAFVSDLYFGSRIESAATHAGCQVAWIDTEEGIRKQVRGNRSESTSTSTGDLPPGTMDLLRYLDRRKPSLLIMDLDHPVFPILEWLKAIKSSAATSNLPVVAYGAHINVAQQRAARTAGADQVLAKSRFIQVIPDLLARLGPENAP